RRAGRGRRAGRRGGLRRAHDSPAAGALHALPLEGGQRPGGHPLSRRPVLPALRRAGGTGEGQDAGREVPMFPLLRWLTSWFRPRPPRRLLDRAEALECIPLDQWAAEELHGGPIDGGAVLLPATALAVVIPWHNSKGQLVDYRYERDDAGRLQFKG